MTIDPLPRENFETKQQISVFTLQISPFGLIYAIVFGVMESNNNAKTISSTWIIRRGSSETISK